MASTIALKRRINSIRGTRQITKAMELVSASKLRRAQEQAAAGRAYREAAYALLARLNVIKDVAEQPLFKKRAVKRRLYIVVTRNSGLAVAYNANIIKLFTQALAQDKQAGISSSVITVGNKGIQFARRVEGLELVAHYPAFGDHPTQKDVLPIL